MYGAAYRCLKGEVDFDAGPVRAALAGAYSFDVDTHDRFSQVVEVSDPRYVAGGIEVPHWTLGYDPQSHRTVLLGDDLYYPTLSADPLSGVVFYLDDGATRPLIAYHQILPRVIQNASFIYHLTDRTIAWMAV